MRPNFTRDAVYHPERLPAFVEHNPQWSFEPRTRQLSLANAWWLANLSHLAYYDESDAQPLLQRVGLAMDAFIDNRKGSDSQALIVSNAEAIMLVFRGTEPDSYQDILADAYLRPVDFLGKGKVHAGFLAALSGDCWKSILEVLNRPENKPKALWISGHSLGAALAMLAAAQLDPAGLYSFGSPRVGNTAFCNSFTGMNFHRFANCSDAVTQVPLKVVLDYQHAGTMQYFDAAHNLHTQPDDDFVKKDRFKARLLYSFQARPVPFLNDKLLFRDLADHAIVNYAYGIWKSLNK